MPRTASHSRLLACARCFRLKRKCDHAKPTCGECRRRGAECLPANSCKNGDNITVPLEYLRCLEARVAELEHGSRTSTTSLQTRDFGIQTEPTDPLTCDPMPDCDPDTDKDNDVNKSPTFCDLLDFDLQRKSPGSNAHSVITLLGGSTNSTASDGVDPMDTNVDDSTPTEVGSLHDLGVVGGYSFWLEEAYTNLYFSITHFMWPLLDCNAWGSWRHDWSLNEKPEPWKGFFVKMVHAIGSLSYNVLQPGQNHSRHAAEMYSSALSYYPYVMAEASAILQIQASILMVIYSLHCPSSGEISMSVSSIVPFCSATLAEIQKRISSGLDSTLGDTMGRDANLNELMFITCYMLNEVIVSGWERPVSAAYRIVDDDIHMFSNEISNVSSTSTALQHLFRLRKIQANIRRSWDEPTDIQNSNDRSFKLALDDWRKDIPQYSVEEAQRTHLDPLWMTKLYDYSVIILMQGKRKCLMREDLDDILSAGVEACLNYRRLQEEGQVMCFTWSALVFQFRTGILLLYICRSASLGLDYIQQAFDAVCACADSLTCFATRWQDAAPYTKVFYFLLYSAPWLPEDLPERLQCVCSLSELEAYLKQLKKQYLHKEVLAMIEDMVNPPISDMC
ncbi:hypothetical protein ANOM_010386 [Aspergillus nomiae NRRL 13137]|uniref:Zn(2)-C6 fungal-type domain-containing protein n=1 Tax=Aspergillus nomiae NRRL (strain ATCC 15546 / NRRL 13137 / CBS 260.88 / M93) TaxID=1509407 RepID=A0A0L1IPP7_ASPN3|nr:uncharacterized protein ANOM_010386 [Aspergillus nomiae NRRL 13137]KNG81223.1 hypothetical protein ANOM_010386 [Aspergillus nomiae NRRL 13137]